MKQVDLNLLASVGTSYDQTRTTIQGRVRQKTVNAKQVLGPNEPKFIDIHTDTAGLTFPATTAMYLTQNNRLFVILQSVSSTTPLTQQHYIARYDFNPETGETSYQGRCVVQLPSVSTTAHSFRSIKVYDNPGTTGWKIVICSTISALVGGTYLVNNVDASDFTFAGAPTPIDFATGNNQKAVYQLVRSTASKTLDCTIVSTSTATTFTSLAHGLVNGNIVYMSSFSGGVWSSSTFAALTKYYVVGATTDDFQLSRTFNGAPQGSTASPTNVNIKPMLEEFIPVGMALDDSNGMLYTLEGLPTSYEIWVRDLSALTPTYSFIANASAASGTPGVITTSAPHGFNNDDTIQLLNGSLPGGVLFKTIYYARNVTSTTLELATTPGGASIAFTSSGTIDIGRPFGRTDAGWQFKTQQLPVPLGTAFLLTDAMMVTTPTSAELNPALNGEKCIFFATNSTMNIGKISDLVADSPFWSSLTQFNYIGQTGQYATLGATIHATYSKVLDKGLFIPTGFPKLISKEVKNNEFHSIFGDVGFQAYETFTNENLELRLALAPLVIQNEFGWLFNACSTVGQRGVLAVDLTGDTLIGTAFIVSKVVSLPQNSVVKNLLFDLEREIGGGQLDVYYRTSGFGSISGGWIQLASYDELSLVGVEQIQFKIAFKIQCVDKTLPLQVAEMNVGYEAQSELSDNWEYSLDDSSSASPTRSGFRLKQAYASAVPLTLTFRAYDLTGVLLVDQSITSNPANFQYSTDGGTTWLALGTIPNVVGTLVRYTFVSPPGTDIRPSLKDS
jgi:hypothetical protein